MTTNAFEEFKWRGLVYDHTEAVPEVLAKEKIAVYIGFDPTADSLHIGSLVGMIALARLQRFGHRPIALAGGGTGMIGDPSGKSSERNLLSEEVLQHNLACIQKELASVLDFDAKTNPAKVVNNGDWLGKLSLIEFLRDTGKFFTVNYMMAKDSVRSRIEREDGISYTEFSYMLLQGYDFWHLFKNEGCVMQAGGSDQWGNIVAGTELIRKKEGQRVHGLVYPLITKADGSKFGKTESGTIWLSAEKTSPYRFYQFWYNADDADVINYLKVFTWLSQKDILDLQDALFARPEKREAQQKLAQEVTAMIHGDTAVTKAEKAAQVLFGGDLEGLEARDIQDIFADVPSSEIAKSDFDGDGLPVVDLLVSSGLASSKGDARRSIQGGGIYVNNQRVEDQNQTVTTTESVDGQFLVLRKGRKMYHLVKLLS
jgi:tyrosyl-tRNA synthetase